MVHASFQGVSILGILSTIRFCCGGIVSASEIISDGNIRHHGRELKEWLLQRGGYMSDKLEIRRRDPSDPTSPSGVFASDDIPQGEKILHIPLHAYLSVPQDKAIYYLDSDDDDSHDDNEDRKSIFDAEMKPYYTNTCLLSQELLQETRRYRDPSKSSDYAPYIRYLEETQSMGQLPATYSAQGKELLRKIQGIEGDKTVSGFYGVSPLPPEDLVDWIDTKFVQEGCLEPDDMEAYHAVALAVQRGFDLEYIPIWDMVNHDVIERLNVETNSLRSPEGLVVKTSKAIHAGEEILYSYNYCTDCFNMGDVWGTPGLFRDFGFLEGYPQLWPFLDQGLWVRVDRVNDGSLQASFDKTYEPDAEELLFFSTQLARLQRIDIQKEIESLTSSLEIYMIRQFYECLKGALDAIVQAGMRQPTEDDDGDDGEGEL